MAAPPKRAAEKLAEDFGVRYEGLQAWQPRRRPSVISKLAAAQEYRKKENRCYRVLCGYFHLLRDWKERYAPQPSDEEWHPLLCEALQKMDYMEYLLDELISGTLEERTAIVKEKEKYLDGIGKKIAAFFDSGITDPQGDGIHGKIRSTRFPEEVAENRSAPSSRVRIFPPGTAVSFTTGRCLAGILFLRAIFPPPRTGAAALRDAFLGRFLHILGVQDQHQVPAADGKTVIKASEILFFLTVCRLRKTD